MDPRLVEPSALTTIVSTLALTPVADIFEFRDALDHVESELSKSNADLKQLFGFADALTSTMGFRASTAEVCEEVLDERKDQLNRITDLASTHSTPQDAFRVLREILRGAYAAIDFTRPGRPGRETYALLEGWRYDGSTVDTALASVETFRAILTAIFDDVAAAVSRRGGA